MKKNNYYIDNPEVWNNKWKKVKKQRLGYANRGIFNEILKHINFENNVLIELGCGTGQLSYLAYKQGAKKIILVDFSDRSLDLARKLFEDIPCVEFWKEDILKISDKEIADIVFSSGVIEHFKGKSMLKAVVEVHKNLVKDDGRVVIVVPYNNKYNMKSSNSSKNIKKYGFQKPLSEKEMLELFTEVGLDPVILKRFQFSYSFRILGLAVCFLNICHLYLPLRFLDKWGGLLLAIGRKK